MLSEVCPSCGDFSSLDSLTGWCVRCTIANIPAGTCITCRREFPPDNEGRRICSTCRQHRWYHRNGDALDRLVAQGATVQQAVAYVTESLRPHCVSCGDPIYSGRINHALFCSKTKCSKAARSYKYYRLERGLNAQEALAKVQENLLIESLIA